MPLVYSPQNAMILNRGGPLNRLLYAAHAGTGACKSTPPKKPKTAQSEGVANRSPAKTRPSPLPQRPSERA